MVKNILALLLIVSPVLAQQPTAQQGQKISNTNVKYVDGVGPGYWPTSGTGLTLNLAAGTSLCGGIPTPTFYAGGTLTMAPNTTNYVSLDGVTCQPMVNTTGFLGNIVIAQVSTSSNNITNITDLRTWFRTGGGGGGGGGTVTSVAMTVPPWLSVTGSPIVTAGTLAISTATGLGSHQFVGTGSGTTISLQPLTTGDFPFTYTGNTTTLATSTGAFTSGHCASIDANGNFVDFGQPCNVTSGGTVTSVGLSLPAELTVTGSPVSVSGTLAATWANAASHTFFGNPSGGSATPSFTSIGVGDLPFTYTGNTTKLATSTGTLTNGDCVSIDANGNLVDSGAVGCNGTNSGTVTQVAMTVPSWLTVMGSPVTTSGTLAVSPTTGQTSHQVIGTGAGTSFSPLSLTTLDLPFTYSGNTTELGTVSGAFVGGNCLKSDGSGNIIDAGGACAGGAAVTSVALGAPTGFTITGSPVTTSGTLAFSMPGGWTTGDLLVGNGANSVDRLGIGANSTCLTSNGATMVWGSCSGGAQVGTVTSVGQTFTGGLISVSGSPVTTAGTLALSVAGNSGGIPYFSSSSTWASSPTLTANLPLIGGGAGVSPGVGTVTGNTTKFTTSTGVFTNGHCASWDANGNLVDSGAVGCGGSGGTVTQVGLALPTGFTVTGSPVTVSGTLSGAMPTGWGTGSLLLGNGANSVTNLAVGANGTCPKSNGTTLTFQPCGAGTVTSVGGTFTGGLVSVSGSPVTASGTLGFTVAGTSGGIPYFSSASTWASSGVLTANLPVFGGGAGVAPLVGTRTGNTTKVATSTGAITNGHCASWDANGNVVDSGLVGCGGSGLGTGTQFGSTFWATTSSLGSTVPPTVNGFYFLGHNVTSSLAVAPTATLSTALPSGFVLGTIDTGNPALTFGNTLISINTPLGATAIADPSCVGGNYFLWASSSATRWKQCNNGTSSQIVRSGVDINTSDQVTVTHLASPLPLGQGGIGATTLAGAGIPVISGVPTAGNCVNWATSTTIGDTGGPCGGSSSGVTISTSGTPNAVQSLLNFIPSAATNGLTIGWINPATTGNEQPTLSGTLTDAGLASAYSGVGACAANSFATTLIRNSAPTCTQPTFTNISGVAAAAQLPTPTATTLGGVKSFTAPAHQWINSISLAGTPSSTQPLYSDISGVPTLQYQTMQQSGVAQTPRPALNLIPGVNMAVTCSDNSISLRTDCTFTPSTTGMINPMTTLGDIIYENASPAPARLAGNTTTTPRYLLQTGTGAVSAAPQWSQVTFAQLGGLLACNQLPSFTGDTTSSLCATTVASTHITGFTNTSLSAFNSTGNIVPSSVQDSGAAVSTSEPFKAPSVDTTGGAGPGVIQMFNGASSVKWSLGTGAPSGVCTIGSIFSRTDGGVGSTLYVCEGPSGAWAAK